MVLVVPAIKRGNQKKEENKNKEKGTRENKRKEQNINSNDSLLCSHIDHDSLVYRLTSHLVHDLEFEQDYTHWVVPPLPAVKDYTY